MTKNTHAAGFASLPTRRCVRGRRWRQVPAQDIAAPICSVRSAAKPITYCLLKVCVELRANALDDVNDHFAYPSESAPIFCSRHAVEHSDEIELWIRNGIVRSGK